MIDGPVIDGTVFVGELTVDAIVIDTDGVEREQRNFERTQESPARWQSRLTAAADKGCEMHFAAGGSIANVAAAYAEGSTPGLSFVAVSTPRTSLASWPLWWPGYDLPALDLTARGICVWGRTHTRARPDLPGCIATIGPDRSVTHLIAWQETQAPPTEIAGELLVIRSDHIELLDPGYLSSFSKLAVLLADDEVGVAAAADAVAGRSAAWMFGRIDQITPIAAGLAGTGPDLTLVGTAGHRAVAVYSADGVLRLDVSYVEPTGSDLGAGDAYMGGFLRALLTTDADLRSAHELGCGQAAAVLTAIGARAPATSDLNKIFPTSLRRRSPSSTEGRLIASVHRSPGLAVLTGGQTGVDELAAAASASAAIPTHVVMPQGGRRETGAFAAAGPTVRVHQLASPSYRYRTWACVYASDAVILIDYAGSEGGHETRLAARWLNRPLIEVADAALTTGDLDAWLAGIAPEAVLIAGNRASLLASAGKLAQATGRVEWAVSRLVRCIRSRAAQESADPADVATPGRLLCPQWLWASPHVREAAGSAGFSAEPVFLPPRDVAAALESGLADAGITWPSLLSPAAAERFVVTQIGVGASYYGFLGAGDVLHRPHSAGVQYREAYARLPASVQLAPDEVTYITGSAESWVSSGLVQTAFDTFHTGQTMERFGLDGFWPVAWETAALLRRTPRSSPGSFASVTSRSEGLGDERVHLRGSDARG